LTWFLKNIDFSIDTYENYKRVYERREELKLASVQTLDEAYKFIRDANREKRASKAKTVAKVTTIESDNQAELKRQATAALLALRIPNAREWVAEATGGTIEEITKDALRLREDVRDPSKIHVLLDHPTAQVSNSNEELPVTVPVFEAPKELPVFALPDENAPLRELDSLVGLAYELMKKEGIARFAMIHDDDRETVIVAEKKPVGRPKKVTNTNLRFQ
jgi:hypothetical protein